MDPLPSGTRITTIGLLDMDKNIENNFYPLKFITHKIFYYAFSKSQIENDGMLISKIKDQMIIKKAEGAKVNFKIYSTEYEQNFSFCESLTHFIQE